ncbi:tRNA pseudouridine38/39 synthase [Marchantia polymorpha subsp. ruderalis]|uniref:Pseudouridine synthase I TruA alpha/beta domain-containing protein n=2 Tax=Marchantia polymorpha TaxID=3197 RepID=A0AAF6AVM5_MARPO|nr:hypothetical protein MARPO_0139s0011 [Marchantia polymorpha]BBN00496.1 hypothetical protein Mp_1g29630 [Marchantia polymorpha subsp. ruderalis]|eukprot:PTQ29533.1 hypothetical protein MARPO_0139s0011 [Marchantia polymorpha]
MEVNSDALVAARERIKELEALVAVLTEKIKMLELENPLLGRSLEVKDNTIQSTAFTPGLPASKDKTKEDIQAGCVNKHNDSHHIPELAAVEHSGLQVETSQKMQREVPELQGDDIVHPVIKNGTCGQEQLTKKGKKGTRGNMKNQSTRHVALKIMYWGSRYQGFAFQPGTQVTVESEFFAALRRTKLLIGDVSDANYSRCGRTDKGVSAIGQLVSLRLRTSCKPSVHEGGIGGSVYTYENLADGDEKIISSAAHDVEAEEMLTDRVAAARASRAAEESVSSNLGDEEEIDYVGVLNRVLPDDIRVLGWCPVPRGFHSRFSCLYREYKYFFVGGHLDIASMKLAASKFLGEHDFRNFCKMDAANVHNYRRTVTELEIVPFNEGWAGTQVWVVRVKGTAFLWHQIRCMVAILFMVGRGYEPPEIVDDLLGRASNTSRKPQYSMASEMPLVLRRCGYQGLKLHCPPKAMKQLKLHLEKYLEKALIHVALIQEALEELPSSEILDVEHINKLKRMHIPLSLRQTEPSYEERRTRSDA